MNARIGAESIRARAANLFRYDHVRMSDALSVIASGTNCPAFATIGGKLGGRHMSGLSFTPSREMVEAIRLVTGVDPFDDPDIIRKALRDPTTAPKIERLYEQLKAGRPA
jgi:hypothetical protein